MSARDVMTCGSQDKDEDGMRGAPVVNAVETTLVVPTGHPGVYDENCPEETSDAVYRVLCERCFGCDEGTAEPVLSRVHYQPPNVRVETDVASSVVRAETRDVVSVEHVEDLGALRVKYFAGTLSPGALSCTSDVYHSERVNSLTFAVSLCTVACFETVWFENTATRVSRVRFVTKASDATALNRETTAVDEVLRRVKDGVLDGCSVTRPGPRP